MSLELAIRHDEGGFRRRRGPADLPGARRRHLGALPPRLPDRPRGLLRLGAGRGHKPRLLEGDDPTVPQRLLAGGSSSATVNLRLSPLRKLARKMADNGLLDPAVAAAIERVPGVERRGTRVGNWLMREQANDLLNAPDPRTLTGLRDRAVLALLLGCGLRRAELLRVDIDDLQQREGRWVLPDLAGKGNRVRTVTIPAGVKTRIDAWLTAANIDKGRLFRPVSKADVLAGEEIRDEKAVWRLVVRYAKATELGKLAPHDLRRTCAKLCRKAGGELEQIQLLLGHASIQTNKRYLGTEQAFAHIVNDAIGLDMN